MSDSTCHGWLGRTAQVGATRSTVQADSTGECMPRWHVAVSTVLSYLYLFYLLFIYLFIFIFYCSPGVAMPCLLLPLPVTPELPAMQPALAHPPASPLHHWVLEGCRHRPWGPYRSTSQRSVLCTDSVRHRLLAPRHGQHHALHAAITAGLPVSRQTGWRGFAFMMHSGPPA
jgi:hypothetical protein